MGALEGGMPYWLVPAVCECAVVVHVSLCFDLFKKNKNKRGEKLMWGGGCSDGGGVEGGFYKLNFKSSSVIIWETKWQKEEIKIKVKIQSQNLIQQNGEQT